MSGFIAGAGVCLDRLDNQAWSLFGSGKGTEGTESRSMLVGGTFSLAKKLIQQIYFFAFLF